MPRRCCVPGCRSNYKGESYTNVFSFPKETDLRLKWERSIHRENFLATNSSVVCIKHFEEKFIERNHHATRSDGTILTVPRKSPILSKEAYPTIFSEQPAYLTVKLPAKRKSPGERVKEIEKRDEEQFQKWCKDDKISDIEAFKKTVQSRLPVDWFLIPSNDEQNVFLGKLDLTQAPKFLCAVKVDSDLIVTVWINNIPMPNSNFTWIFGVNCKCDLWTKFDCLMSHVNNCTTETTIDMKLKGILTLLSDVIDGCECENYKETIMFLRDQLQLCLMSSPRYQPHMLLFASHFFFTYPAAYKLVRNSGKLILPHPFYLKKLLQNLGALRSGIQNSHINYLKKKCFELSEREKLVILMMDEIYVKSGASYKGGKIEGLAGNIEASTLQVFMIASLFSHNKDVVGLFPMKNQTADQLFEVEKHVIKILHQTGYKIICIVADNNRVNRKSYEKLCGGNLKSSIPNPECPNDEIFLIFDTVHILKCVRNNWLNQKETNQTFFIPRMNYIAPSPFPLSNSSQNLYASIMHLKTLYKEEAETTIKLAPSLTRKALYPNNLERQNVSHALRLFDEKLIAALESSKDKIGKDVYGTLHLIDIISKWWRTVNVKTPCKGRDKRDQFSKPIDSMKCPSIEFLKNFCTWIEEWEALPSPLFGKPNARSGKLSQETSFALKHTTHALIQLCKYLFEGCSTPPRYVLLGKFQTDPLEARFGQYRSMSGENYHVSVIQILESERKLKVLSLMSLNSSKLGTFMIKHFLESCKDNEANEEVEISDFFFDVLLASELTEITDTNLKVLVYIAGYVARVSSKSCLECKYKLSVDRMLDCDVAEDAKTYLSILDRGGLLWPSNLTIDICSTVFRIFQTCILINFEEQFLKVTNQRLFLCELAKAKLFEDGYCFADVCQKCGKSLEHLIFSSINVMANILLNNYVRCRNDVAKVKLKSKCDKSHQRKLSTLTTTKQR